MIGDVVLDPLLWESLEAGDDARVERWLASEGDHVRAGQPIARVRLLHQALELVAPHQRSPPRRGCDLGQPLGPAPRVVCHTPKG